MVFGRPRPFRRLHTLIHDRVDGLRPEPVTVLEEILKADEVTPILRRLLDAQSL